MDGQKYKNLIVLAEEKQQHLPSQEQIIGYGQYLGLTFPADDKFKPLLLQALTASLPQDWQACQTADLQQNLVYRNKKTRQVIEQHPLDGFYREKIARLKNLTQNLTVQTILEERESWLKESSEIFGPSRNSAEYSLKDQEFINQISQEKSVYDQDDSNQQPQKNEDPKRIIINKAIKTPRTYRRKKEIVKTEEVKQRLLNYNAVPRFSVKDIREKKYPVFQTTQLNEKLKVVVTLNENLETRKEQLRILQRQRKKKQQYLQILKNKIKLTYN